MAGAPEYQLEPLDHIQRRSVRIIMDPLICGSMAGHLGLHRDVSSLCAFNMGSFLSNCSIWYLLPEFWNRKVWHKLNCRPHHLNTWHFITVRFCSNFLPRATQLWNALPAKVSSRRYDMGAFKKRFYFHLKGQHSVVNITVMGDDDHLLSGVH